MTNQVDIFPPHLIVNAIRDNGYKTTAHAVAELVDNSAQADATVVQVMVVEQQELVKERTMFRIQEIAVLDNLS